MNTQYSNVVQDNLWEAFNSVSIFEIQINSDFKLKEIFLISKQFNNTENINLVQAMKSWTLQNGYPLIRINLLNSSFVSFSQEPFSMVKSHHNRFVCQNQMNCFS